MGFGRIRRQTIATATVIAACAGCERSSEAPPPPAPAVQQIEYKRHMRQGLDLMRRGLLESAAAELENCRSIRPHDSELLFHTARLRLAQGADVKSVLRFLEEAIILDERMVKAHRLLYVLHTKEGQRETAAIHRAAVVRLYGALGAVEMDATDYHLGRRRDEPAYAKVSEPTAEDAAQTRFAQAARQLERVGYYDPGRAVPAMESLLREYPDLTALRLFYAEKILYNEVRIYRPGRSDLPPVSSRLIMDYAQIHFERVIDRSPPGGKIASKALFGLATTALRMGDYDDAVVHLDNLLSDQSAAANDRSWWLSLKGLARYKQHRFTEAVPLLEKAIRGNAQNSVTLSLFSDWWNLHLAYEDGGIPLAQRTMPFRFRPGLPLPGDEAPLSFKDIAAEMGVNKFDGLGPSAWCDYDHDGDFDLFVCGCDSYGALYRNDGDRFRDVSAEAGLFHVQSGFSATLQDYDNDGCCDLYIGRDGWNGPAPNSLYRNNGDGTFTDRTDSAGVGHPGSSFVHSWLDYNRDGFLDLYVANGIVGGGDTNVLYRNNGDGTFTDATAEAGLKERRGTKTIGFAIGDYDKDGWPDLFVGGWNGPHRLYRNGANGTFREVAVKAGLTSPSWESSRYVSFFFDYDNDTWPDILMTNLAPFARVVMGISKAYSQLPAEERETLFKMAPKLYRNNRDGTFTDVSRNAGFLYPIGVMGANVADVDNDGFQDVYFATGDPAVARMEPDRFFRNNGDGTFTDWTFATGLGNLGKGHGVTFVDIDHDGDLDMYVPEGGFVHGDAWENAFYRNLQATGNGWLHIDLQGDPSNRDAVGTSLTVTAGGMTQLRQVKGGRGFGSSDSPTVEFGLGKSKTVERLEIRWPSGTHQSFEAVGVNQRIFVHEGRPWVAHSKDVGTPHRKTDQ